MWTIVGAVVGAFLGTFAAYYIIGILTAYGEKRAALIHQYAEWVVENTTCVPDEINIDEDGSMYTFYSKKSIKALGVNYRNAKKWKANLVKRAATQELRNRGTNSISSDEG